MDQVKRTKKCLSSTTGHSASHLCLYMVAAQIRLMGFLATVPLSI